MIAGTDGAKMRTVGQGGKPRLRVGQLVQNRTSPTGWMRIVAIEDQCWGDPDQWVMTQHYREAVAAPPTPAEISAGYLRKEGSPC